MKLAVWDEMMSLERRLDDLFREFLGPRARITFPMEGPFVPTADVFTRDGDLVVRVEIPGIDPAKDVEVTVEDGTLTVRGERKRHEEIKEKDYYRMETSYGSFERRLPIPEGVKDDDVKASYDNGVLEVTVPGAAKAELPAEPKKVQIRTGGNGG